jgi:hypothetical protein
VNTKTVVVLIAAALAACSSRSSTPNLAARELASPAELRAAVQRWIDNP